MGDEIERPDWGDGAREVFAPDSEDQTGEAGTDLAVQQSGEAAIAEPVESYLGLVVEDVQKMHPGFSREEAVETVAQSAEAFLESHIEPEDRAIFVEVFDSFSTPLQAKLLNLLVQHGTQHGWRAFYECRVRPKLTLSEQVEINELL